MTHARIYAHALCTQSSIIVRELQVKRIQWTGDLGISRGKGIRTFGPEAWHTISIIAEEYRLQYLDFKYCILKNIFLNHFHYFFNRFRRLNLVVVLNNLRFFFFFCGISSFYYLYTIPFIMHSVELKYYCFRGQYALTPDVLFKGKLTKWV